MIRTPIRASEILSGIRTDVLLHLRNGNFVEIAGFQNSVLQKGGVNQACFNSIKM